MGICCASEMFQNIIERVLQGLKGQKNLVDDIFVWGRNQEEHDKNLFAVLKRLSEAGLTLNHNKCEFRKTEMEFFGLQFSSAGVSLTDSKIRALKEAAQPSTPSELRSFLGLANFASKWIPKLATLAAPLWDLLKETKPHAKVLNWKPVHTQALKSIKDGIIAEAMGYFKKGWKTHLEVDASPFGVGAVLFQVSPDGKKQHIVACWSQLLNEIERRYSQVEREALGLA